MAAARAALRDLDLDARPRGTMRCGCGRSCDRGRASCGRLIHLDISSSSGDAGYGKGCDKGGRGSPPTHPPTHGARGRAAVPERPGGSGAGAAPRRSAGGGAGVKHTVSAAIFFLHAPDGFMLLPLRYRKCIVRVEIVGKSIVPGERRARLREIVGDRDAYNMVLFDSGAWRMLPGDAPTYRARPEPTKWSQTVVGGVLVWGRDS